MAKQVGSNDSFARLSAAGWTIGDIAVHRESGLIWVVSGDNGKTALRPASQRLYKALRLPLYNISHVLVARRQGRRATHEHEMEHRAGGRTAFVS